MAKSCPLVLGAAQFGSHYGIANTSGRLDQSAVTAIVREAWEHDIDRFDTAQGYGDSEVFLGKAFRELGISGKVKVISKVDPAIDPLNEEGTTRAVEASLKNLGVPRLHGLLIHNENALSLWGKGLNKIFEKLVRSGSVGTAGISVYAPQKALEALDIPEIGILQVPTNVLDRRFENSGVFQIAQENEKEVYIRSIFLQGLLFLDPGEMPERMGFAKSTIEEFSQFCRDNNVKCQDLAIGYLRSHIPQAYLLFGAENVKQVQENINGLRYIASGSLCQKIQDVFNNIDEKVLNPSLWGLSCDDH